MKQKSIFTVSLANTICLVKGEVSSAVADKAAISIVTNFANLIAVITFVRTFINILARLTIL
jgi:hypothetical protein